MRRHLEGYEWAEARGEIFTLYRDLGIDYEDERHRVQHALTGCPSLRYMTPAEHRKLIETLREIALKPSDEQQKMLTGLLALSRFDYHEIDE